MEEKTTLQKIKEQLEKKMTRAIVAAIDEGTECKINPNGVIGGLRIDGVFLTPKIEGSRGFVLNIDTPEIDQLFEPNREYLKSRAEELRAELEEIEKQLKSE